MENGILHIDMNNFYASVETLYAPEYRNVPMAVAGDEESRHGIILAKNMLAKERGVKTAEPIWQAKRKCPDLRLVPPHFERYQQFSRLATKIYCEYTDKVESFGLDECWLDVYGSEKLFGDGVQIAETIRTRIKQELGLTVSIGVSFNKVFAKLGSDYKKPDAITVFGREQMQSIIWKMPCSALLFVGKSTEKTLKKYGLNTIGDIAATELNIMRNILGKAGETLWVYAKGLDDSLVSPVGASAEVKSVGNSTTLPRDVSTEEEVKATLLHLAEKVSTRLRKQNFKAGEIQLTVRNSDFEEFQRQCKIEPAVCDSQSIYKMALNLYRRENKRWAIRLLGIRAGALVKSDEVQTSLFAREDIERRESLESAVDILRERYGRDSVRRAFSMAAEQKSEEKERET